VLELKSFEQSEIPFFLLMDIDVDSLSLLFGTVFLFERILDSFRRVYFLFEFAVFKLLDVEYDDWTKL
jgi:hypothetical protein